MSWFYQKLQAQFAKKLRKTSQHMIQIEQMCNITGLWSWDSIVSIQYPQQVLVCVIHILWIYFFLGRWRKCPHCGSKRKFCLAPSDWVLLTKKIRQLHGVGCCNFPVCSTVCSAAPGLEEHCWKTSRTRKSPMLWMTSGSGSVVVGSTQVPPDSRVGWQQSRLW